MKYLWWPHAWIRHPWPRAPQFVGWPVVGETALAAATSLSWSDWEASGLCCGAWHPACRWTGLVRSSCQDTICFSMLILTWKEFLSLSLVAAGLVALGVLFFKETRSVGERRYSRLDGSVILCQLYPWGSSGWAEGWVTTAGRSLPCLFSGAHAYWQEGCCISSLCVYLYSQDSCCTCYKIKFSCTKCYNSGVWVHEHRLNAILILQFSY